MRSTAGKRPAFLADIAAQLSAAQTGQPPKGAADASASQAAENVLFVRFPQQPLRIGTVTVYRFKNGTSTLSPLLDHRYEPQLGTQVFAFSVRNGQTGRHGSSFEYLLLSTLAKRGMNPPSAALMATGC